MPADRLSCWPASEEEGAFVGHGINRLGNTASRFRDFAFGGELTSYHHLNQLADGWKGNSVDITFFCDFTQPYIKLAGRGHKPANPEIFPSSFVRYS